MLDFFLSIRKYFYAGLILAGPAAIIPMVCLALYELYNYEAPEFSSMLSGLSSLCSQLSSIPTDGALSQFIIFCTAVDTLIADALICISVTFGLTIVVIVASIISVIAIIVALVTFRAALKIISIITFGISSP